MATLYSQQTKNVTRTWLLMVIFLAIIITLGYFLANYYQNQNILYIAIIFSLVMNLVSYWYSDKIVIKLAGARPASREEFFDLYTVVENLAITAGLPNPKIYVIN